MQFELPSYVVPVTGILKIQKKRSGGVDLREYFLVSAGSLAIGHRYIWELDSCLHHMTNEMNTPMEYYNLIIAWVALTKTHTDFRTFVN